MRIDRRPPPLRGPARSHGTIEFLSRLAGPVLLAMAAGFLFTLIIEGVVRIVDGAA